MKPTELLQSTDNVLYVSKTKGKDSVKNFVRRERISMRERIAVEKRQFNKQFIEHKTKIA